MAVVRRICSIVSDSQEPALVSSALKALNAIATTSVSAEEGALSDAVPTLVNAARQSAYSRPAFLVLNSLT